MMGNIKALAMRPGMPSVPTIRKLIALHRDFPIVRRGGRGVDYVIKIEDAEQFIRQKREQPRLDEQRRQQLIKDLGLQLLEEAEARRG